MKEVSITLDETGPLGITIDEKLVISEVKSGTPAEGKLAAGDRIVYVSFLRIYLIEI